MHFYEISDGMRRPLISFGGEFTYFFMAKFKTRRSYLERRERERIDPDAALLNLTLLVSEVVQKSDFSRVVPEEITLSR